MANTYTLINSTTVGSGGTSSVTFSSIPATYTDLLLRISARDSQSQVYGNPLIQFNGSSSGYTGKGIQGSGSAAISWNSSGTAIGYIDADGNTATTNTFGSIDVYIPNYLSSNYKSISIDGAAETNGTTVYMDMAAWLWSNTAAINSIVVSDTYTILQYSSFYLYGISNS
jgi:hypothetical protein